VDALVDAILGAEVLVKVDFGLGDAFEVGVDDDGWRGFVLVAAVCDEVSLER
jgi:hypothetical protein